MHKSHNDAGSILPERADGLRRLWSVVTKYLKDSMKRVIAMLTLLTQRRAAANICRRINCACESAPWHVPMQVVEGLQVAYRSRTGIKAECTGDDVDAKDCETSTR